MDKKFKLSMNYIYYMLFLIYIICYHFGNKFHERNLKTLNLTLINNKIKYFKTNYHLAYFSMYTL